MLTVHVDGIIHEAVTAVLVDGRADTSAPVDRDGNTAMVTLMCSPGWGLLVDPRMTGDETRIDCMTCLVRRSRT